MTTIKREPDGTISLPDWVKPGAKFHWLDVVYHVRGVVDGHAVCRWRSSRGWCYECLDPVVFLEPTNVKQTAP